MSDKLSSAFWKIQNELELSGYLNQVCSSIVEKTISKKKLEEILTNNEINYSIAKVDLLHLIFEYIKIVLQDNILTVNEKEDIKLLKLWFGIQPGDFLFHNSSNVENIIAYQLSRIYKDNFITDEEALFKVDLQEIFDLSFDQMNDYSKTEASFSIQQGADPKDLDIFFTQKEYFKLKSPSN
jgi:hypothetical protein